MIFAHDPLTTDLSGRLPSKSLLNKDFIRKSLFSKDLAVVVG